MDSFSFDEFFEAAPAATRPSSTASARPRPAPTSPRPAGGARPTPGTGTPSTSSGAAARRPGTTTSPATTSSTARPGAQPGSSSTRSSGGFSLSSLTSGLNRVSSYAQQAWDLAQSGAQGVQQAQQFAASLGLGGQPPAGGTATATPSPADSGQPARSDAAQTAAAPVSSPDAAAAPQPQPSTPQVAGLDQIAALLQALQQRQIPPLAPPAPSPATVPAAQTDALAMLRVILTNPQLQRALQPAAPGGAPMSRTVQLPVPTPAAPQQLRPVPIPLHAVLGAILSLAGNTTGRPGEDLGDDEASFPEYLVGDDGRFLVDPSSADDRAALVAHLFRLNDAARRSGRYPQLRRRPGAAAFGRDSSDDWAREAGFL